MALCVVLARAMFGADSPTAPQETAAVTQTYPPITSVSATQAAPVALPAIESETMPAPAQKSAAGGLTDYYLVVVNADSPLPWESTDFSIVSAYRKVPLMTADTELEEAALDAVTAMFQCAKDAGIDTLIVTDGYRDYETQKGLYSAAADKSFVQLPGCSEHQTGLAVDIGAQNVLKADMEASREGGWLAENAAEYGFILRYPKDKTAITGISYEPWHFRYVGVDHARYMYENNLCLEEYVALLGGE